MDETAIETNDDDPPLPFPFLLATAQKVDFRFSG